MRRRGYTLAEMLLQVSAMAGILLVLAALLSPILIEAVEAKQRGTCRLQLQQIGVGLQQYVEDYDGHFPPIGGPPLRDDWPRWRAALGGYLPDYLLFDCPARGDHDWERTSYGFNGRVASRPRAQLTRPQETVLVGDCRVARADANRGFALAYAGGPRSRSDRPPDEWDRTPRHSFGSVLLRADGSVTMRSPSEIVAEADRLLAP